MIQKWVLIVKKPVVINYFLLFVGITLLSVKTLSAQVILYDKTSNMCSHEKNVLFNDHSNELQIVVEGIRCRKIDVIIDSGKVIRTNCTFFIQPHISTPNWEFPVIIEYKNKCDTLLFTVIDLPEPSFGISGMSGRHNRKGQSLNLDSIVLKGFCGDSRPVIDSFSLRIIRGDELLYGATLEGSNFSERVKLEIEKIVAMGDIFEIREIFYSQNDKSNVTKSTPIRIKLSSASP